ncbi:MAG: cation transporter [Ignavibacteria bacterium]|nr:cation transporter [Ignavibacteria bacterium]MCU7502797.1 cation transporter [Ignavibacteria bacterium]MCU7517923.1 cation transporter [Ignavibacteria bacterium]
MASISMEEKEKKRVASSSLIAAVFLTSFKLVVGISTNSLGILSEAAHSGLDLVAALVTYIAIRMSSKPADEEHHFGHGKMENISALFETVLLLITCFWIISEVIKRLTGAQMEVEVNFWSFLVILTSMGIDISRSNSLRRIAKKYKSQALEADALHFSSDIFSSGVVLIGLAGYAIGFHYADSIAALIVAIIVIFISLQLGRRSIDVLLDKAPEGIKEKVSRIVSRTPEVLQWHDIRVRNSGANVLVELKIHVAPNLSINKAHEISHRVEESICSEIEKCEVQIHIEPEETLHVKRWKHKGWNRRK